MPVVSISMHRLKYVCFTAVMNHDLMKLCCCRSRKQMADYFQVTSACGLVSH